MSLVARGTTSWLRDQTGQLKPVLKRRPLRRIVVKGARTPPTGGQINVAGILYQMLLSLADGLETTVSEYSHSEGLSPIVLYVEPFDGRMSRSRAANDSLSRSRPVRHIATGRLERSSRTFCRISTSPSEHAQAIDTNSSPTMTKAARTSVGRRSPRYSQRARYLARGVRDQGAAYPWPEAAGSRTQRA
jgi:hypothetical protein